MAQYATSVPEQRENPPEPSDAHWEIIEAMERVGEHLAEIEAAQDAWGEFNHAFMTLAPPATLVAAWEMVLPWLATHRAVTEAEMADLESREMDLLY